MQVVVSDPALGDLADIWLWIARDHPLNAERYIAILQAKCQTLARHPRSGRPRPELGPRCRGLNIDSFMIVYRIHDRTVQVLRVLDGRRDLRRVFLSE